MIAININAKRIRIRSADTALHTSEYELYLELTVFWLKSPWLGEPIPFAYDVIKRRIFVENDWTLQLVDRYGDIVAD